MKRKRYWLKNKDVIYNEKPNPLIVEKFFYFTIDTERPDNVPQCSFYRGPALPPPPTWSGLSWSFPVESQVWFWWKLTNTRSPRRYRSPPPEIKIQNARLTRRKIKFPCYIYLTHWTYFCKDKRYRVECLSMVKSLVDITLTYSFTLRL